MKLYRFEPEVGERIDSLELGKLWMSDPAKFNDPFDIHQRIDNKADKHHFSEENLSNAIKALYKFKNFEDAHWIFDESSFGQLKDWIEDGARHMHDPFHAMQHGISGHIAKFGVQCFSKNWDILLSWAHYASAHAGFCIEYELQPMPFVISNSELAMYEVEYSNRLPKISVPNILLNPKRAMQEILACKSLDWSYEQEVRIVHFEQQNQLVDIGEGLKISALISGLKMSGDHKEQLKQKAKALGAAYKEVEQTPREQTIRLADK